LENLKVRGHWEDLNLDGRAMSFREERKLRVFENMVLRRIFGPRRDEVTGEWRIQHNE